MAQLPEPRPGEVARAGGRFTTSAHGHHRRGQQLQAANITAGLLPALGIQPQLGRNFSRDEETYGKNWGPVLISDRLWKRRFEGRKDVLGDSLKLNGRVRTIVGVMPPNFNWPETEDLWIPMSIKPEEAMAREDHLLSLTARLKPGVTRKQAEAEVAAIYARIVQDNPKAMKGWTSRVNPFAEDWRSGNRVMMIILKTRRWCQCCSSPAPASPAPRWRGRAQRS